MKADLNFECFSKFIREFIGVREKVPITPLTKFENDLGVTGDDGCDLLSAVEKEYEVKLSSEEHGYRTTFKLGDDEYLFHSEGFDLFGVFGKKNRVVEFTVGQLYEAVIRTAHSKDELGEQGNAPH